MNISISSTKVQLSRVPRLAWGIAAGLAVLPIYLRYFAWALGQCGVGFWAPIR